MENNCKMCYTHINNKLVGDNMSVVLTICTHNFVKMFSDGRVIRFGNNTPPYILKENYNKLRKINKNVILGFTGDKDKCKEILSHFNEIDTRKMYLEKISEFIHSQMKNIKLNNLPITFMISGISQNGTTGLHIISSINNYQIIKYYPHAGQWAIKASVPFIQPQVMNQIYNKYFSSGDIFPNVNVLHNKARDFICDIANIDMSVNKNIHMQTIINKKYN